MCDIISEDIDKFRGPMQRNYDYILKACFLGETAVGKTSLLKRYADDEFSEEMLSTIGVDFKFK
jgi:GTPase SAR1 family protein